MLFSVVVFTFEHTHTETDDTKMQYTRESYESISARWTSLKIPGLVVSLAEWLHPTCTCEMTVRETETGYDPTLDTPSPIDANRVCRHSTVERVISAEGTEDDKTKLNIINGVNDGVVADANTTDDEVDDDDDDKTIDEPVSRVSTPEPAPASVGPKRRITPTTIPLRRSSRLAQVAKEKVRAAEAAYQAEMLGLEVKRRRQVQEW